MNKHLLRGQLAAFLAEDIGCGDLTSEHIFPPEIVGAARLVARQAGVAAGVETVAAEVFRLQNEAIMCEQCLKDGQEFAPGAALMTARGPICDLLKAERVALNLLQHLCGIARLTRQYARLVAGTRAKIVDTRKTTPGLRMLEKYAVTVGGGYNHRFNLADGVLVKDNHIAACGGITTAVTRLRGRVPHTLKIEVECDTLEQVEECLACGVDSILLDNMTPAMLRQAVDRIGGKALVEASGGVNLETVAAIAATGVDLISVGALTHSAPHCDIGMDWL
ncbi:MAG: carboxylating nicotinate-nucleotide diphosphorylase [Desulfobulbaceae bacterium]|jgi:nicotinate-nucleotide pyrophosphorylase (carboxylating)|nr:carboxylating nicotinate-nucleotide diphosphorylase [Desulfobulbaceae bacterium]